jgi:ketosteroid isomerase-like protein/catechol 2,3-dioxygenase-like lactoylglutathione lyase family enzyme
MASAALVRLAFERFLAGDTDGLRELLAPDVQWLAHTPGPWDCQDREKVLRTLGERHAGGVVTALEEVVEGGEQVLVTVTGPRLEEGGLPDGRASLVVTVRDGRIVRLQDHRTRALASAGAGLAPVPAPPQPRPPSETQPGWDRVRDLIPFVHVRDVERSIAFYERLGFAVTDTFAFGERLDWAALEAGSGRLMLARADAPVDPDAQAVLFYLYARDLFALRERLVADGVAAGEIFDGSPGPRVEMRVTDPDGYCLMIAQIGEPD